MNPYHANLRCLPGMGAERAALLEKEIGCTTIEDLLVLFSAPLSRPHHYRRG